MSHEPLGNWENPQANIMSSAAIVIPCYNEQKRLHIDKFKTFIHAEYSFLFVFVNDGSTDQTLNLLMNLQANDPNSVMVVNLPQHVGKGEAVRQGILVALELGVDYVGYWDADLSTPLNMIPAFRRLLDNRPDLEIVMGARVRLLGRIIERKPLRHYLGRLFATAASLALGMGIYDTQCGAKLLRTSSLIISLFQQPFITRWLFDIEILARLIQSCSCLSRQQIEKKIYEFPLYEWHDVAGSKVKPHDFFISFLELARIYYKYLIFRDKILYPKDTL